MKYPDNILISSYAHLMTQNVNENIIKGFFCGLLLAEFDINFDIIGYPSDVMCVW